MSNASIGSAEHLVGGRNVHDVFVDPPVASLAAAACEGNVAAIRQYLTKGVDVNSVGLEGSTPLMWAVSCDNVVGMEALLKAGANPNQVVTRFTPVYAAATRYDPRPLLLLLRYGGDPNAVDTDTGVSALRMAETVGVNGHGWDNYDALLNMPSIDVNRVSKGGETIAIDLCRNGQFDRLAEILERGYDHDLNNLGSLIDIVSNKIYDDRQTVSLKKVRQILEARGVKLPPMPIPTIR